MAKKLLKEGDSMFLVTVSRYWGDVGKVEECCNLKVVRANRSSAYAINADEPNDARELRIKQSNLTVERGFNCFDDFMCSYTLYNSEMEYKEFSQIRKRRREQLNLLVSLAKTASAQQLESAIKAIKEEF